MLQDNFNLEITSVEDFTSEVEKLKAKYTGKLTFDLYKIEEKTQHNNPIRLYFGDVR